jgi:hypothetical protein
MNVELNNENMVFQSKGNELYGGGFKIKDRIFNQNNENINNLDIQFDNNKKMFENLIIPFGLYFNNDKQEQLNKYKYVDTHDVVNEDIFNKLLNLVNPNEKKNLDYKTRKNKKKLRKTKKKLTI